MMMTMKMKKKKRIGQEESKKKKVYQNLTEKKSQQNSDERNKENGYGSKTVMNYKRWMCKFDTNVLYLYMVLQVT